MTRAMEPMLSPNPGGYGIHFYAYSPLGGGFFARPIKELRNLPTGGRMDQVKFFQSIYVNNVSVQLLGGLTEACKAAGSSYAKPHCAG